MSSLRRLLSSRANGAKSRGPVTPQGKAISSRNAITHGITARGLALGTEEEPEYQRLLEAYHRKFHPRDEIEAGHVEQMAIAQWNLRRIAYLESAHIDMEIERQAEDVDLQFSHIDDASRTALAFVGLEERTGAISLYGTYGVRERNAFRRHLRELSEMRCLEDLSGPSDSAGPAVSSGSLPPAPQPAPAPGPQPAPVAAPESAGETTEAADSAPAAAENTKSINEPSPISGHPADTPSPADVTAFPPEEEAPDIAPERSHEPFPLGWGSITVRRRP